MKFITNNLKEKLNVIKTAVPARTALPVLEGVYIKADETGIHLIASSVEHEMHTDVDGDVLEHGVVVLDAKLLSGIVSSLEGELTLETVGEECIITYEKKKYKLPVISPDAFPVGKYDDFSEEIEIPNFRQLVTNTIFAVSPNDSNRVMTALCLNTNGSMAGLESFRIAVNYFEGNGEDKELLIPAKYLKNVPETAKISYNEKFVRIEGDGYTSYILLLDGKYFKYGSMLNMNETTSIKINREEYIAALKTLSLFTTTDKRPVVHTIKEGMLTLDVVTAIGKGNEEIEIERTGEDLEIGFNPKYLVDALSHISDETITIKFTNKKSPALIEGENYKHLLLPVSYAN